MVLPQAEKRLGPLTDVKDSPYANSTFGKSIIKLSNQLINELF